MQCKRNYAVTVNQNTSDREEEHGGSRDHIQHNNLKHQMITATESWTGMVGVYISLHSMPPSWRMSWLG